MLRYFLKHLGIGFILFQIFSSISLEANSRHQFRGFEEQNVALSYPSFCDISHSEGSAVSPSKQGFWNLEKVQQEILAVAQSEYLICSPFSAYPFAYARMTKERDRSRCEPGNPLKPDKEIDQRLNDALADLMTRHYLNIVADCLWNDKIQNSSALDPEGRWCQMFERAERENWDAVRLAMGSTSLYLSIHIGLAVSALPHIDVLWAGTEFIALEQRLERLVAFKPTYDQFNHFLANHLLTVSHALDDAGLMKNHGLHVGARLGQILNLTPMLFGNIRDRAWHYGLVIAKNTPVGMHPWTVFDKDYNGFGIAPRIQRRFPELPETQEAIRGLVDHGIGALNLFSTPLLGVLGGYNFHDLDPDEIPYMRCMEKARDFATK